MRIFQTIVRGCCLLLLACALVAPALPAAAQNNTLNPNDASVRARRGQQRSDTWAAPQPSVSDEYVVWFGYLIMFVLVATVLLVSLMPSKRSHQD